MVRVFLLLMLSLCAHGARERVEEQRKYNIPPTSPLPQESFLVGDFRFHPHDVYVARDLYFDSPAGSIYHAGLGMRIRRVKKGQKPFEYVLQVKTEMETPGAVRQEEEDRDLLEQSVRGVKIVSIIDQIAETKLVTEEQQKLLGEWFERKSTSSLAPSQVLRRRGIPVTGLRAVVLGDSHRQRYHILLDREERVSSLMLLKNSEKNQRLVPAIFREKPHWVWLMEASWDEASFTPAAGGAEAFIIKELEIENKYRPREMGTVLLNKLEQLLLTEKKMEHGKDSKFRRAYEHFVRDAR